ncbi:MAG: hypothetical protein GXO54_05075 [Chloroflexi bacterium]|nr:hypothetical protein [Chloroflexota bacterium]
MKKLLWLGIIWNWGYIFTLFFVVLQILTIASFTTQTQTNSSQGVVYCEELAGGIRLVTLGASLASIATLNGLFWYAWPVYIFYNFGPTRKSAIIYTLWVILGTIIGLSLFFLPGVLATWSLTSGEYQYTTQEKVRSLIKALAELFIFTFFYAGSGLGYVWAYWKQVRTSIR